MALEQSGAYFKIQKMALEIIEDNNEGKKEKGQVQQESFTSEQVAKIVKEQLEQQMKLMPQQQSGNEIAELAKLLSGQINGDNMADNGQFNVKRPYTPPGYSVEEDVLPEEEWVTFFSHQVWNIIVDDKRNGIPEQTPFKNEILFKYESTKQVKNGNEVDLFHLCKYTCKSKIELEWLRNHSFYNVTFFDRIDNRLDKDAKRAGRLVKYMLSLKNYNQHDLVKIARDNDVAFNEDLNALRLTIANKIVDRELESEKNEFSSMFESQMKDSKKTGQEFLPNA